MLDLVNFRPSVPQTDYCYCCFFAGCAAEKEKKREENGKSQKNLKLKDKRETHLSKNLRKY